MFGGLGEVATFGPADFNCAYPSGSKVYVCAPRPTSPGAKAAVMALQRAADVMIGKLPFFLSWSDRGKVVEIIPNPIGTSKAGYDGKMGPFSSNMIGLALIGALELLNQAGELENGPPAKIANMSEAASAVILGAAKETREQESVWKKAFNAPQLEAFLNGVSARFDDLLALVKQKAAAGELVVPVMLKALAVDRNAGLTVEIPAELATAVRSVRKLSAAPVVLGMAFFGILTGLGAAAYASRHKKGVTTAWPHGGM